jgi:hypothetical protein
MTIFDTILFILSWLIGLLLLFSLETAAEVVDEEVVLLTGTEEAVVLDKDEDEDEEDA